MPLSTRTSLLFRCGKYLKFYLCKLCSQHLSKRKSIFVQHAVISMRSSNSNAHRKFSVVRPSGTWAHQYVAVRILREKLASHKPNVPLFSC